jgi:hypothetical protein
VFLMMTNSQTKQSATSHAVKAKANPAVMM